MNHQWSFEVWTAEQMAKPAGCYPMQLPGRTGRIEAPDAKTARAQAAEIAVAKYGPGAMVGAGQHFRYECCKAWPS